LISNGGSEKQLNGYANHGDVAMPCLVFPANSAAAVGGVTPETRSYQLRKKGDLNSE